MAKSDSVKSLPPDTVHLCVDMQRLFGPGSEWELTWMPEGAATSC